MHAFVLARGILLYLINSTYGTNSIFYLVTSIGEMTSLDSSMHTPLASDFMKKQELKIESVKSQVSDLSLAMMHLNTKIDHLETLLKEVLTKLDNK